MRRSVRYGKRKNWALWAAILLVGLMLYFLVFPRINFLYISQIRVEKGVGCISDQEIINASRLLGKAILFVDSKDLEKILKEKYVCIDKVSVKIILPATILLTVSERKAVAKLFVIPSDKPYIKLDLAEASSSSITANLDFRVEEDLSTRNFLTDEEGFLYELLGDTGNLQKIYISEGLINNSKVIADGIIAKSMFVVRKLQQLSFGLRSVRIVDKILLIDGDIKLVFSFTKDLNRQFASLQLILQEAKMNSSSLVKEKREIERIDLRFEKPVVLYVPERK